jgi:hypothetical protein
MEKKMQVKPNDIVTLKKLRKEQYLVKEAHHNSLWIQKILSEDHQRLTLDTTTTIVNQKEVFKVVGTATLQPFALDAFDSPDLEDDDGDVDQRTFTPLDLIVATYVATMIDKPKDGILLSSIRSSPEDLFEYGYELLHRASQYLNDHE